MGPKKVNLKFHIVSFHKCIILLIAYFITMSYSTGDLWGANIYINPTYNGPELGTFEKPYNSWYDIQSYSALNDYRQKCGTTFHGQIKITGSGNSANPVIIGAYYDGGGTPVHEDEDPSFGRLCGNSALKPIVKQTLGSGALIVTKTGGSQYLEISSIQLRDALTAIQINSNRNRIRYCYLYNLYWGIRVGVFSDGDYNTLEYNYINLNTVTPGAKNTVDAIKFHGYAAYNTVQYNHITGYDHAGIGLAYSDSNTIQYNYIFAGTAGAENESILHNYNADRNVIRFNYFKDAGVHLLMGGNNNEIYGNIYSCNGSSRPLDNQGCVAFESYNDKAYTSSNNKFYNNIIYNNKNVTSGTGIQFYSGANYTANISGNEIINNIILKISGYCIIARDYKNVIGTNYFKNNLCYDYGSNKYAQIEGSIYPSASAFNRRADASGNRDDNPGLKNPSADQFWPSSLSSNVVGNGYTLGFNYNRILNQDSTDLEASPPRANTKIQPANWYIGAYVLSASILETELPPPGDLSIIP